MKGLPQMSYSELWRMGKPGTSTSHKGMGIGSEFQPKFLGEVWVAQIFVGPKLTSP